jgi:hypothetical protein
MEGGAPATTPVSQELDPSALWTDREQSSRYWGAFADARGVGLPTSRVMVFAPRLRHGPSIAVVYPRGIVV